MTDRGRRWPWVVAAAAGIPLAVTVTMSALMDPDIVGRVLTIVLYPPAIVALLAVGALLVSRVPGNRVGVILLAAGITMSVAVGMGTYAQIGEAQPRGPWPGTVVAALLNQLLFIYPLVLTLVIAPLYFPDGRLPSRRWPWRAIIVASLAALAASNLADVLRPGVLVAGIENPLGTEAALPLIGVLEAYSSLASILGFGGAATAIVVRYRRSSGVERKQLKWLVATAGLAAIVVPASFLAPNELLANLLFIGDLLLFAAIPIAIGVAILRYRLYAIDRIVSRTIGWALVTGAMLTVFVVMLVALQTALAPMTRESTLAVAASTLGALALFQPLRRRIQRAVDRRFNRGRYDADRTAQAFRAGLRDELDLGAIRTSLVEAVGTTVQPTETAVWLRRSVTMSERP
ncbi:MAG TPA: hypothetical protein VFY23_16095 [Candidatus Limnocylindrales bacterium]|nr:hypothetical protein [Candidatus Limnocylindrales bacterium]